MTAPIDLADLRTRHARGERFDYVYFWGHRPSKDGSVTKSCFSQWYEAKLRVDGTGYATAEHYMMAEKARLFGDDDSFAKILRAKDPGTAKSLGRKVKGFDEATWTKHRHAIVLRASLAKFGQNEPLKRFLLRTGDAVLVEASPTDAIWGIGAAAGDPDAGDPMRWRGLNLLGFALMQARETLRGAP